MEYVEESVAPECVDVGICVGVLDAVESAAADAGYRTKRRETERFDNHLTTKAERLEVYCDRSPWYAIVHQPDLRIEMDNIWEEHGGEVTVEVAEDGRYEAAMSLVESELTGCG